VYKIIQPEMIKEIMPSTSIVIAGTGVGTIENARVITQGRRPMASKSPLSTNAAKDTVIEVGTIASRNAAMRIMVLFSSGCQGTAVVLSKIKLR
jgi:hypothetical protein